MINTNCVNNASVDASTIKKNHMTMTLGVLSHFQTSQYVVTVLTKNVTEWTIYSTNVMTTHLL